MSTPSSASIGLREVVVGLISGAVVAAASLAGQAFIDDSRSEREDRRENLRFVRSYSSQEDQRRPFQGLDLTGTNLAGLELPEADFSQANLSNAYLWSTDLDGAFFASADVSEANFEDASLREAYFLSADLSGTTFEGADLSGANFIDVSFQDVELSKAMLDGADFARSGLDSANFIEPEHASQICYDSETKWPTGFSPPAQDNDACDKIRRQNQ